MTTPLPLRAATLLGAFLLFLVQPILAKQILPWFGGAPAVWTACLFFFQMGLTAGYLYAHLLGRLNLRRQAFIHAAGLVGALLFLPILVSSSWQPQSANGTPPTWRVLGALVATAGVPYVLLAATSPLIQSWWRQVSGREPYRLYSLSNLGSLVALLAFPMLIEPAFGVPAQSSLWSVGYSVFLLATAVVVWRVGHAEISVQPQTQTESAPRIDDYAVWILLSACGSGMLAATTNQVCQDVAVVPLLWLLPLVIYLATFILTFGELYPRTTSRFLFVAGAVASLLTAMFAASVPVVWQIASLLCLLGGACMVCHGELVSTRPAPSHLTIFYVAISAGGALGGALVTLVAPIVFTSFAELPMLAVISAMGVVLPPLRQNVRGLVLCALWLTPALALGAALRVLPESQSASGRVIASERDFFGVLRVQDHTDENGARWRGLYHGRVLHGLQSLNPAQRGVATAYYAEGSGVALAFQQHRLRLAGSPLRTAVVGLGVGTVAAWARAGDDLDFYELNPHVADVARAHFTYLQDSPARTRVILGDARLSLDGGSPGAASARYDLLIVDAFAGDSVPVHLLTREAFAVFSRVCAPGAVVAFHVSNRHLNLASPVTGAARELRWSAVRVNVEHEESVLSRSSDWILLSSDAAFVERAVVHGGTLLLPVGSTLWTDRYSTILPLLR